MSATITAAAGPKRRYAVDQEDHIGYPMCPVGRTIAEQVTENDQQRSIHFPIIGWQMEQQKGEDLPVPSTMVYDVYYGLTWMWKEAGFPDDGVIRFSRYDFLQSIGWVSNGRSASGKLMKPSGRHYTQLTDACKTLVRTAYFKESQGRSQGFNVLSSYDIHEDRTGPRALGEELPKRSRAVLNPEFIRRLKNGTPLIHIDLEKYLALPSTGAPRPLFRVLSWMRHHGITALPIEELFNRVGSVQKQYLPATARKMLEQAQEEFIKQGVIDAPADFHKTGGVWHVGFSFADPEKTRYEDEVLVREAVMCGVNQPQAQQLIVAHRSQFERVMAFVAAGLMRDRKTLPGTIVTYSRRPDIPLIGSTPQFSAIALTADMYRTWLCRLQDDLVRKYGIDVGQMAREVDGMLRRRGVANIEAWMSEGLVRMRLSHRFNLPSLDEYAEWMTGGVLSERTEAILSGEQLSLMAS